MTYAAPPKVLLLIESGGPGGAERVVLDLARGMKARAISVQVVTFRTGWLADQLRAHGIPHEQLSSGKRLDVSLPFRLASYIQKGKFQVLHSHLLDSNFYGAMAASLSGVRHLATEHGDVHHTQSKKMLGAKLKVISWCGSTVTAVSRFTAKRLEKLGVPAERIQVVGNPLPIVAPATKTRNQLRNEHGIDEHNWLWLHLANLRPVKDQATLLKGFSYSLKHSSTPQTLCVLGDGPERGKLEALVQELGIQSQVRFLGFRTDVENWLAAADGSILSSKSEALPMSLLEAARAGLILVSSAVGGVPEILIPGKTGYLFAVGDSAALGETLVEILTDQDQARKVAQRAQRELCEQFDTDRVLDRFLELYC